MKLNCIITDDEPIAREIMAEYIKLIPELELVAICNNAVETLSALRRFHVDLIFIDIQMPEISGLELLRSLDTLPYVIFTTAHPAFAVEGFELDAIDYLLKRISKERFLKAVNKVYARCNGPLEVSQNKVQMEKDNSFFFVKSESGLVKINTNEILYIEGLENYVKIICETKTVITLRTMKSIDKSLSSRKFLRIHRSYIVNIDKVESVRDFRFHIKSHALPVGKSYKKEVLQFIKGTYLQGDNSVDTDQFVI